MKQSDILPGLKYIPTGHYMDESGRICKTVRIVESVFEGVVIYKVKSKPNALHRTTLQEFARWAWRFEDYYETLNNKMA